MKKGLFKVIAGAVVLLSASAAQAVAPANSTITNTASLTYAGLTNAITATVDVKVLLVKQAPTVIAPTQVTVAENQTATLTYTLRSNANGPDTYSIDLPVSTPTNVSGSATPSQPANIVLGATAAAATAAIGATVITVPSDGVAGTSLNGIVNSDSVVIGGIVYTVQAITDTGTGSDTITLTTSLTAAVAIGDPIGEQKTFDVTMQVGTMTAANTTGTEVVSVIGRDSASAASAATLGTINVVKVLYNKSVSVNGAAFVTATPNVKSGDTLTYRLLVEVPAGSTLNSVKLTDTIPLFMTYVAGSTTQDVDGPNVATNTPVAVTDNAGVTALVAGLLVNSVGQATAGVIAGGAAAATQVSVEFKVTVD